MAGVRIDQITFTRFIAAFGVVAFHYGAQVSPFDTGVLAFFREKAYIGVSYFFALSGFIMVVAYHEKERIEPLAYFRSRFARVYPVYLLALILYSAVSIYMGKFDGVGTLLNALVVQAWFPSKALSGNFPGWSIAVEFLFYGLFPLLFNQVYSRRRNLLPLVVAALVFWGLSQAVVHWLWWSDFYQGYPSPSHNLIFYFPLMHLHEFILGNVAGLIFVRKLVGLTGNYTLPIIALLVLMALLLLLPGIECGVGLLTVPMLALVILISLSESRVTRLMQHPHLIFLGEISYGMYILQVPIHAAVVGVLRALKIGDPAFSFYLFLVILIVASGLSYVFIEVPLRKRINRTPVPGAPTAS